MATKSGRYAVALRWTTVVLLLLVFAVDIRLPRGIAAGVPYVGVVLVSLLTRSTYFTVATAVAICIFTVVGVLFSPPDAGFLITMTNRGLAIGAVVVVASLGLHLSRAEARALGAQERLRTALQGKEVLLREVHHRVKNSLQIVSSLLSLEEAAIDDERPKAFLRDCQNRIRSLAKIHEQLCESEDLASIDFSVYCVRLLKELQEFCSTDVTIDVTVEVPPLDIEMAIPCGLIVNELVTNSLEHAFVGRSGGRVTVTLERCEGPHEAEYALSVTDDGVGLPAEVAEGATGTLGLRLVSALAGQLGGGVEFESGSGTAVRIAFPGPSQVHTEVAPRPARFRATGEEIPA